jgi:hypothetical protein
MIRIEPGGSTRRLTPERRIELEARRRGLKLRQVGAAWLLTGPGVRLMVKDLSLVRPADLIPRD